MSLVCLALAVAQPAPQGVPCAQARANAWRPAATEADRQRLRDGRTTFTDALAEARAAGKTVDTDPLFDPDRALDHPLPPAGTYRCRYVKLGGAAGLVERDWGRCEVGEASLVKRDGPQRPVGAFYPDTLTRGVFLGSLLLGDETRPVHYGRDARRDLAGVVERVDNARWRIALPHPAFESTLDLIELIPAQ